jgi:hypothetical protein
MNLCRIVATMTLDAIVAFDTIVAFHIPLVALLMPWSVMCHKEHPWYFSVLQRVHSSILIVYGHKTPCCEIDQHAVLKRL